MRLPLLAATTAIFLSSGALADGFVAQNIPAPPREAMIRLEKQGRTVRCAAFAPDSGGSWIVLPSGEAPASGGLRFRDALKLSSLFAKGVFLNWAAFSPGGGLVVLYDESGYYARDLPEGLAETLEKLAQEKRQLKHVSFTPAGRLAGSLRQKRRGAPGRPGPACGSHSDSRGGRPRVAWRGVRSARWLALALGRRPDRERRRRTGVAKPTDARRAPARRRQLPARRAASACCIAEPTRLLAPLRATLPWPPREGRGWVRSQGGIRNYFAVFGVCQRMALEIENLTKTYPNGVRALDGVSLSIPHGLFGLLGPNGAGKSSLMRTIATLQEPDTGSITLDGVDTLKNKEAMRATLGYLPQEFGFYPTLSGEATLDHFATLKGIENGRERKGVVEGLLAQVNLWDARKKNVGGYSGGMKQRLGIAVALLAGPKVIIVDEPTAGLDPTERNRFLNLLAEVGEGATVILSTHIVEDVRELCERAAILTKGRVVAQGNPEEVIGRGGRKRLAQGHRQGRAFGVRIPLPRDLPAADRGQARRHDLPGDRPRRGLRGRRR